MKSRLEMEQDIKKKSPDAQKKQDSLPKSKRPFKEPRLKFVEPKIKKRGNVTELTGGFLTTDIP